MSGTTRLLQLGADRQKGNNQEKWLSISASLLEAELSIDNNLRLNTKDNQNLLPIWHDKNKRFVIRQPLKNSRASLLFEFESFTEKVATTTAFLLLNEVGRFPVEKRQNVFDNISQSFSYPVYRIEKQDLDLDSRQLERLERGETIIEWDKQFGRGLSINVYAPWGTTSDVLKLGSIELFDPYPVKIVVSFLLFALVLMAMSVFFIIKHLARQLYQLQDKVDAISPGHLPEENTKDPNVIAQLTLKVQNMASRIEKLLNEKAYMIRAVSHDLRTPIAKMHFRIETLYAELGEDNLTLQGCDNDLEQLNQLIDELLTYEKLTLKQEVEFEEIEIYELLKNQIQGLKLLYPQLKLEIKYQADQSYMVYANEALLCRLLDNLLSNAGRYASNKILITLTLEKNNLLICIDDDGEGLDEKVITHLFNPFFRADTSRNSDLGGYGLGLAIVKQVAIQHNANIEAMNNSWGGARFVLTLPITQNHRHQGEQHVSI